MSEPSNDNPIINCTVKQLAFVAWQSAVAYPNMDTMTMDLNFEGSAGVDFTAWWNEQRGSGSIRDLCWGAYVGGWNKAGHGSQPHHGTLNHFNDWWQTILAAQPVVSSAP